MITRTPDHSLMSWEVATDLVSEMEEGKEEGELEDTVCGHRGILGR